MTLNLPQSQNDSTPSYIYIYIYIYIFCVDLMIVTNRTVHSHTSTFAEDIRHCMCTRVCVCVCVCVWTRAVAKQRESPGTGFTTGPETLKKDQRISDRLLYLTPSRRRGEETSPDATETLLMTKVSSLSDLVDRIYDKNTSIILSPLYQHNWWEGEISCRDCKRLCGEETRK